MVKLEKITFVAKNVVRNKMERSRRLLEMNALLAAGKKSTVT